MQLSALPAVAGPRFTRPLIAGVMFKRSSGEEPIFLFFIIYPTLSSAGDCVEINGKWQCENIVEVKFKKENHDMVEVIITSPINIKEMEFGSYMLTKTDGGIPHIAIPLYSGVKSKPNTVHFYLSKNELSNYSYNISVSYCGKDSKSCEIYHKKNIEFQEKYEN